MLPCSDPSALEKRLEISTRKDGLRLLEGINLLIAGSLPDLKVLHHKVAALVQFGVVVGKLLKLQEHRFLILVGLGEIGLCLGLLLRLVDDGLALLLDGGIGLLHKIFISLLGILFG